MKVWTLPLKYSEDKVWEYAKEPVELEIPDDVLEDMKYGEKPVIEMFIVKLRSIVFVFLNEESAICYQEGFKFGISTERAGDALYHSRLDQYIEAEVSNKNPITDRDFEI
jgi:hypothetical protein